jgi:hypothetical protein
VIAVSSVTWRRPRCSAVIVAGRLHRLRGESRIAMIHARGVIPEQVAVRHRGAGDVARRLDGERGRGGVRAVDQREDAEPASQPITLRRNAMSSTMPFISASTT